VTGDVAGPAPDEVLGRRLEELLNRITDAGGDPDRIDVVAVTKGFDADVARTATDLGLVDLGENYAQELVAKAADLAAEGRTVRWHAIGRLQRNKVRSLAGIVDLWQSVDRASLGAEIARRAPGAAVLVQVNVSDEAQKGGCAPEATGTLVQQLIDEGLDVRGLMTVGRTGPADEARRGFDALARLADGLDLPVRSMGMSADLEAAVRSGATMVRPGTALFGPRPPRR
jgi:PLP dependent protein